MSNKEVIIDRMKPDDIDQIVIIEKLCFTQPWSRESFIREVLFNKFAHYFVARLDNTIVGYVGFWHILDEAHITNIAVHPEYRRRGIASRLLEHLIKFCFDQGIEYLTLEVRKNNFPAQKLYKKYGFVEIGIRKGYYSDTNEDAIIMSYFNPNQS